MQAANCFGLSGGLLHTTPPCSRSGSIKLRKTAIGCNAGGYIVDAEGTVGGCRQIRATLADVGSKRGLDRELVGGA